MLRRLLPWPVGAFVLLGAVAAHADDPPAAEPLPPPRALIVSPPGAYAPGAPSYAPGSPYYRVSRYDVWKYYSVDRYNQFRPRVAISPYGGAYYLYDGSPYYYVPLNSREFGTTLMGTSYR